MKAVAQMPTVTMTAAITHNTCGATNSSVDYEIVVSNGWKRSSRVTSLKLYYDNQVAGTSDLVYDHLDYYDNQTPTGTVRNLPAGHYTFTGTITTSDSGGTSYTISFSYDIWIGYKTQWNELSEMIVGTTLYSLLRNSTASGNTYGWGQSFNASTTSRGWIEIKKKPAASYPSTTYCVLDPITNLSAFTSGGSYQYLEFSETSSTAATIKLKYYNGSSYVVSTISTAITDKVRVIRSASNTCVVQLNQSTTNVAPASFTVTGTMKVSVLGQQLNAEAIEVTSAFPCEAQTLANTGYSRLKREIDGGYALTASGTLKFYFEEEYRIPSGSYLPLKVYDLNHQLKASVAMDGTLGVSAVAGMRMTYTGDDNRCSLPLTSCGLSTGEYYILEVETSTKEKRYLKFKYIN